MGESDGAHVFNLGNGPGFTVLHVIEPARRVTGVDISFDVHRVAPAIPRCSWHLTHGQAK